MSRNRAAERESKESNVVKKTTLQCPQLKLLTASRTCELGTHEGAHEFPGAAVATPSLKSGHRGFLGVRGDPCPSLPQAAGGVGSSSFLWQHLPSLGLLFLSQISLSLTLFFFFFSVIICPGACGVPGPGIRSQPQLPSAPKPWQCWARSFTPCAGPGREPLAPCTTVGTPPRPHF